MKDWLITFITNHFITIKVIKFYHLVLHDFLKKFLIIQLLYFITTSFTIKLNFSFNLHFNFIYFYFQYFTIKI